MPDSGEDAPDQVPAAQMSPVMGRDDRVRNFSENSDSIAQGDLAGLDDYLQPDHPTAIPVTVIAHCRHFGASVARTQLFTPQFGQSECGSDTSPQFSQHAAAPQAGTSS